MPASSSANWITKLIVKYLVTPGVLKDLVGKACGGTGSSGGQAVLEKLKTYIEDNSLLTVVSKVFDAMKFFGLGSPAGQEVLEMFKRYTEDESLIEFSRVVDAWDFIPESNLDSNDPPVWGPGLVEPPGGQDYANRYVSNEITTGIYL